MVSAVIPSGEENRIEPVVVSLLAAELEPAGSPARAGSPASATPAVAFCAPTGWSVVTISSVGLRSIGWG
jgi:hypothetical protein